MLHFEVSLRDMYEYAEYDVETCLSLLTRDSHFHYVNFLKWVNLMKII